MHIRKTTCFPVLVLFLLIGTHVALSAIPLVTVRSGHAGPVNAIVVRPAMDRLFTAGQDGKVMVWEPSTDRLLQTIRADRLAIQSMALFPDGERIALYASDGRREHRVSVWNWKTGERIYLHNPDDEVLWMEVSPQGSYVVYSVPGLRSIRLLDASTGRQLPFLRQSTGIVSWFVTATSEERVMTYSPSSGAVTYRNVVTGSTAGNFQAPANLKRFTLLEQRRYAAVETSAGMLGILDLLSGDIVTEIRAGDIESIERDPGGQDILVLSRTLIGGRLLRRYRFQDGVLQQRFEARRTIPDGVTNVTTAGREMFGTDRDGRILRWPPFESEPLVFAEPLTEPVRDLYISENRLFLLTADNLLSVSSDFFRDVRRTGNQISYVDQRVSSLPAGQRSRFIATRGPEVLLWTPEGIERRLHTFSTVTGRETPLSITIPPGIVSMSAHREEVVLITRAGLLQIINYHTGAEVLTYRGQGFQTAIRTDRDVFLGKAYEGGILDSSILRIDPQTGQTVPMETEARLVFALSYDHQRGRLFAIGLVPDRSGELNTVIEVFDGPNYSRRRTVLEIPGEHLDAQVVVDPVRGTAYTTLDDRGGILRWDGVRITELSRNQAHIPRRLMLNGDYVFSVNWDGTVSLIERFDGELVMDIVVMKSETPGDWIALRPDGRFFVSRDHLLAPDLLSVNEDSVGLSDLVFQVDTSPAAVPPSPLNRFETGRSRNPAIEAETEEFDPESGAPAPSS